METSRQGGFLDETDGMDRYAVMGTSSYNKEN